MSNRHPPWHRWYDRPRWKRRARFQLRKEPFCRICMQHNVPIAAEVADHVLPHHGNPVSFWFGPLQSLCKPCHDGAKRFEDINGFSDEIGLDGYPLDPRHPIYTGRVPASSGEPKAVELLPSQLVG